MTTEALAILNDPAALAVRRPPAQVLEEARQAAVCLKDVIDNKAKPIKFNGEQYLEFEDWQTAGRFYGITAKVVPGSVEFVNFGGVTGFRATAIALRADGFELSSATAACLNDEEKWRSKAKYERQIEMQVGGWVTEPVDESAFPKSAWKWLDNPRRPSSRRVKVGEEPVPLFQVMSMAETRACAKVLRQVLAWVVVLAGYKPTPAEELDGQADQVTGSHPPPAGTKDGEVVEARKAEPTKQSAPASGQPTAAAAPGATTVKKVTTKTGTNSRGEYTTYKVAFADGRSGSTFSDTVGQELEAAAPGGANAGALVNPDLQKTADGKYWNIVGLLPVALASPEKVEPQQPDEPVDGPEKVLTVRRVSTDKGDRWIIQTGKRQLVTDVEKHATDAVEARSKGLGIVPIFDVVPGSQPGHTANKLTSFTTEAPVEREVGAEG